jgi:hypothetical protein
MTPDELGKKYPARTAAWNWHDAGRIDLLDDRDEVIGLLDLWQTAVYFHADGNRTTDEIAQILTRGQPENSSEAKLTLKSYFDTLSALLEQGRVVLWDRADDLPFRVDLPRAEQSEREASI